MGSQDNHQCTETVLEVIDKNKIIKVGSLKACSPLPLKRILDAISMNWVFMDKTVAHILQQLPLQFAI